MKVISNNKRANYDYFISDVFEAGIVLEGSEVKSIRAGNININDCFIFIRDGEVFLKNAYIKPYEKSSSYTPDSRKDRKLLLKKTEINKLSKKAKEQTIIPLKVGFVGSFVKVEIGIATGKKLYDKKEALKQKSAEREIQQAKKTFV